MLTLPFDIPIEPDADTAREWVEQELNAPRYSGEGFNVLEKLARWFQDLFSKTPRIDGPQWGFNLPDWVVGVLTTVLVVAVLGAVGYLIYRNRKSIASTFKRKASVFEDDDRPSEQIRDAAERAADAKDWDLAVIERFRALVRRLEEAEVVEVTLGMTAYEFVLDAREVLTSFAAELDWAGRTFDAIRYGQGRGNPSAYARMTSIDDGARSAVEAKELA